MFYSPAERAIVDLALPVEGGVLKGLHSGQTESVLVQRYPDLTVVASQQAIELIERAYTTQPMRITKEAWTEALECMPPKDWIQDSGWSHFKLSENLTYGVTRIFIRHGQCYYQFVDKVSMTATDIRQKVHAFEDATTAV